MNPVSRFLSVPIRSRFYQISNGVVNYCFGKQLKIVHLVEYPRCGGTWIRHLLQDYTGVRQFAYDRFLTPGTIVQCHVLPNASIRKAVVLFRDPRDAITSFYFKKIGFDKSLRGGGVYSLGGYTHDPDRDVQDDFCAFLKVFLVSPDHPRFSFGQLANGWLEKPACCFTSYEKFRTQPEEELSKVLTFLGQSIDQQRVQEVVRQNSFENRTKARSGVERSVGNSDIQQFERKGIVGDWVNAFNGEAREIFDQYEGATLIKLGYEKNRDWIGRE